MYINFLFTKVLYLLSYMDICISIILYLFLLFTGLHAKFQVWWCYDFDSTALQQEEKKNLKNYVSLYFPHVMSKYISFWLVF